MAYQDPNLQVTAGGNIRPSRVVKISTVADNQVLESAGATTPNIGIAQMGTRRAPGTGDDDGYAAISGENVGVYGPGAGASPGQLGGTVTRGDAVTSDSNGLLVTTTTEGDCIVGWALQSGVTADLISILVQPCYMAT